MFDVLGLKLEKGSSKSDAALEKVMQLVLEIRAQAKIGKDFKLSDEIRDKLIEAGVQIKDTKEGSTWKI